MLSTLATIISTLAVVISGWFIPTTLSNQSSLEDIQSRIQGLEIQDTLNAQATQKLGSTLPIAGQTYTLAAPPEPPVACKKGVVPKDDNAALPPAPPAAVPAKPPAPTITASVDAS